MGNVQREATRASDALAEGRRGSGTPEEKLLAERVQPGDRVLPGGAGRVQPAQDNVSSWELFFRSHSPSFRRVALSSGVKTADLDDCCQEAWIEVVKRLAEGATIPPVEPERLDLRRCAQQVDGLRPGPGSQGGGQPGGPRFLPARDLDPAVQFRCKRRDEILHEALAELVGRVSVATYDALYQASIEERDGSSGADELGLRSSRCTIGGGGPGKTCEHCSAIAGPGWSCSRTLRQTSESSAER